MCTASNPLVVMFTASGWGKSLCARLVASLTNIEVRCKSLYARLVASPTNMEVRCKSFSVSTFALLFFNEKWKVENGKILSPLQGGGRSCACLSKLQMRGGGSSSRDILKKPTLQSWYRQYKLGSEVQKPTLQSWHCQYKHGSGVQKPTLQSWYRQYKHGSGV